MPRGSRTPELVHPLSSCNQHGCPWLRSPGMPQGENTCSSTILARSPAPFQRPRLPRASSQHPLTCASLGCAAGQPLRAVPGRDIGVGAHAAEECQAWEAAGAAQRGSPGTPHRPATAAGRALAAGSAAAPTAPLRWQHQPFPRAGRRGSRSPPAASTHQRPSTGVWGAAWWVLDHTDRPAAPLPREDAGRDPRGDPESWNHWFGLGWKGL